MTNKNVFLLMGLIPFFFCTQNAQGMRKKGRKPLGWKIKWQKLKQPQAVASTYRCMGGLINFYCNGDPTLFVGSVPKGPRKEQLELFRSKLILKTLKKIFCPSEFDIKTEGCITQRKSTLSQVSELENILQKTNRLDKLEPNQRASIKLLLDDLSVKKLRENFKSLFDNEGNNLLFFTAQENDFALFEKILLCANEKACKNDQCNSCKENRRCVVEQKNKFGISVLDVLGEMETERGEKFLNLLQSYGVVIGQEEKKVCLN